VSDKKIMRGQGGSLFTRGVTMLTMLLMLGAAAGLFIF
jgi:hypothetical protein